MTNYFKNRLALIKGTLFVDRFNFYSFISAIVITTISKAVWVWKLSDVQNFFWGIGTPPLTFLWIVLLANTVLSIIVHDKEKEMSNLLMAASGTIALLILILEIFVIFNY